MGDYQLLGETIDDAIGESFDKVAKLLGLGYPGGPLIEKLSISGKSDAYALPHPLEFKKNLNFSFSGIKTAVSLIVKKQKKIDDQIIKNIAASFQSKIIEILTKRTVLALNILKDKNLNIKDIAIVGGVAANKKIYQAFESLIQNYSYRLICPPLELCGDNAAMIAWTCFRRYKNNMKPDLEFNADPRLNISEKN